MRLWTETGTTGAAGIRATSKPRYLTHPTYDPHAFSREGEHLTFRSCPASTLTSATGAALAMSSRYPLPEQNIPSSASPRGR